MKGLLNWFKTLFEKALVETIAGFVAGILLTVGLGAIAYRVSSFLLQPVTAPVVAILIIALFAVVGVLVPGTRLWRLLIGSRPDPSIATPTDSAIQSSAASLRRLLATVEAGPDLRYEPEVHKFAADLLASFDDWDVSLRPRLSPAKNEEVQALRSEIAGRSLLHSRQEATEWLESVKALTEVALARRR